MSELSIAIGKSRKTKVWKNIKISWNDLVDKFRETTRTGESYKDYIASSKETQSSTKDRGGFVGGFLSEGQRSPANVAFRQILTLDLDFAEVSFWRDFKLFFDCEAILHTTHKHSTKSPRYRIIIPLNTKVTKEQYEAIARKIAGILDIELFDPTTFQPSRLMYWPTSSKDGQYIFQHQKGKWLDPQTILDRYERWEDISSWPFHADEIDPMKIFGKQAGDPNTKPGLIGAFCRTYNIHDAIANFLGDIYLPTDNQNRYTYAGSEGFAGAVVYEDKFMYSNHGSDPTQGKLLNSWDLVRLHKFSFEDIGSAETEINKKKSQKLMTDLASSDKEVISDLGISKLASLDFNDGYKFDEEDFDWIKKLTVNRDGKYEETIDNFRLIIKHDPNLKGRLMYNEFSHRESLLLPTPWRAGTGLMDFIDSDDSGLRHYLEQTYGIYHVAKSQDAMRIIFIENAFHPVREYLESVTWDGRERIERLMINHLGAEDTHFNRSATRKALIAAVARVYIPGCKFDYMPILIGPQGIGKSRIIDRLGGEWYSDSFLGVEGTQAYEQLQGIWIMEVAELAGMKKADVDSVKHFISKRIDRFRVAYGKRPMPFPRQGTFWGTDNRPYPLKDDTGGRRFWPIPVTGYGVFDVDEVDVDQVWAEAKVYFDEGEQLYFDTVTEQEAREVQASHTEQDDRAGMIANYLSIPLPTVWPTMGLYERQAYLGNTVEQTEAGELDRLSVCAAEIWCELFKGTLKDMGSHNTKYIHQIMANVPGWEKSESALTFPMYGKQRCYTRKDKTLTRNGKRKADRI